MERFYEFILNANGGTLGDKTKPILEQFFEVAKIVFPVFFAVVAIGIIIRIIFLGMKLAKVGDDPEGRSKVIKGMIWWGVGLLICIAAIAATATVFSTITGQSAS